MKIVSIPHPTLRKIAATITRVDKKLLQFIDELDKTLAQKDNPRGVGLAAPQVDTSLRIFATFLHPNDNESLPPKMRTFINPSIVEYSQTLVYGSHPDEPRLEGCLSIPGIYGPVPRAAWVMLEFDEVYGDELRRKQERFSDFAARVVQHESDHLDGVLFIDHTLREGLPLYKENRRKELVELAPELIETLVRTSQVGSP